MVTNNVIASQHSTPRKIITNNGTTAWQIFPHIEKFKTWKHEMKEKYRLEKNQRCIYSKLTSSKHNYPQLLYFRKYGFRDVTGSHFPPSRTTQQYKRVQLKHPDRKNHNPQPHTEFRSNLIEKWSKLSTSPRTALGWTIAVGWTKPLEVSVLQKRRRDRELTLFCAENRRLLLTLNSAHMVFDQWPQSDSDTCLLFLLILPCL